MKDETNRKKQEEGNLIILIRFDVNTHDTSSKKQWLFRLQKKARHYVCCLQEMYLKYQVTDRLVVKE